MNQSGTRVKSKRACFSTVLDTKVASLPKQRNQLYEGDTALSWAAKRSLENITSMLLDTKETLVNEEGPSGSTALITAVTAGNIGTTRMIAGCGGCGQGCGHACWPGCENRPGPRTVLI